MEKTLLNLIPGACSPEVHLSQYDKGRAIPFKLAEGKSAYSVPDGSEIVVQATKPSGLGFVVPVTFDGDTATMTITETMSNEYGRFPAELTITNNGNRIGTANFVMNIERSPHPEGTIDGDAESLLPELTLLVERIEAAADSVDEDTQTVTEAKAEVLQAKADTLQAKADTLSARDESVSAKDLAVSSAETSVEASQRAEQLVGSVETKADAIVKTASGEIASFTDGGDDLPMKSLKVNIVPKQSGSGEPSPSNVRPISGYEGVNVTRCGKNLFNPNLNSGLLGTSVGSDDTTVTPSNRYGYSEKVPTSSRCRLSFKSNDLDKFQWICVMRYINGIATEKIFQSLLNYTDRAQVNIPAVENSYIRIMVGANSGYTVENTPRGEIQVEIGSTMTEYEPYQGTSYPISLGQTVYGGTLEVVSGKLTITKVLRNLGTDQSGSWYMASTSSDTGGKKRLAISLDTGNIIKTPETAVISNVFKTVRGLDTYNGVEGIATDTNPRILFYKSDLQTVADWKSWATTNNLTVCYELETPTEITLTPTQVTTLLGNNNIFADSGSVEVEYRADTTLAYNELLSLIASL